MPYTMFGLILKLSFYYLRFYCR